MENCVNHPGTEALSICKGCGEQYCEECLTEGNNYYYCSKPDCKDLLLKDKPLELLPGNIECPDCLAEVELSEEESKSRKFHCPECESYIDYTTDPPKIFPTLKYIQLLSSFNQADISIIKSILDNSSIDYYFTGENFLSVDSLIQPAKLFIIENKLEEAGELLKELDFTFYGVSNPDSD